MLQSKKRFYWIWFTENTEMVTELTEKKKNAHRKSGLIMIFTDKKKSKNFFRIFKTEDTA